ELRAIEVESREHTARLEDARNFLDGLCVVGHVAQGVPGRYHVHTRRLDVQRRDVTNLEANIVQRRFPVRASARELDHLARRVDAPYRTARRAPARRERKV